MRKRWVGIILSSIISVTMISCSFGQNNQLTTKAKVQDFNQVFEVIEKGYPYLEVNKRVNGIDFIANKEAYIDRIENTTNDVEFISELSSILADLNNGHTHLITSRSMYNIFKEQNMMYGWYRFFDTNKVKQRYEKMPEGESFTSSTSNGELKLEDIVFNEVGYMHLPTMEFDKEKASKELSLIKQYLQRLSNNHKALIIDIRGNSGGNDDYWEEIVSMLINKLKETKGYMLFRDSGIINGYIDERNIKISPIKDLSSNVLKNAPEEAKTDFTRYSEVTRSIPVNPMSKFNGKIYLLVDEGVYSSAESFAIFSKETNFATVVGTTTGGDGGGIDPVLFYLQNSGLIMRMPSEMYLTGSGVCNEEFKTTPDIIIDDNIRDPYLKNDNAINKVLELEGID